MTRLVAVANQKGGVGKSTLTANLAVAWAARPLERRVLVIDLDPQCNLSEMFGRFPDEAPTTIEEVLVGKATLAEAIVPDAAPGVSLVQASPGLAGLAQRLVVEVGSEGFLARALRDAVGDFDVVLVDCPPELGQLTTNALFACSEVVVPVAMTDKNSCNGAVDLMDTLAVYGERGATSAVTALVRSHVKPWENTYKTLNEDLEQLDVPLAVTEIPATVEFSKASIKRRPLTQSRPGQKGAVAYFKLADELDASSGVAA